MGTIIWTYLDPGSGSLFVQAIIGALAAAGLTIRIYWHRILRALGLKKVPKPDKTPKK